MNAISPQLFEVLAWTLIHFLWQGLIIGILGFTALKLLRKASPQTRYLVALGAFLSCIAAPLATFFYLWQSIPVQSSVTLPLEGGLATTIELIRERHYPEWLIRLLPELPMLLVIGWMAGAILGLSRLFAGYLGIQWMRHRGAEPVPPRLQRLFDDLCEEMQVSGRAVLRISHRILTPMTVGWVQPLVLLPAGAWLGLRPEELRLILAHELAHIRRWDYLVNLLQQFTVAILFFHPVVHWLSRVLSEEREVCCDEMVVRGREEIRLAYARALLHLQEHHAQMMKLALAARGGAFLRRIYRLLAVQENVGRSQASMHGVVGLLMVSLVNLVFMLHANDAVAKFAESTLHDPAPLHSTQLPMRPEYPLDDVLADVHSAWVSARMTPAQAPAVTELEVDEPVPARQEQAQEQTAATPAADRLDAGPDVAQAVTETAEPAEVEPDYSLMDLGRALAQREMQAKTTLPKPQQLTAELEDVMPDLGNISYRDQLSAIVGIDLRPQPQAKDGRQAERERVSVSPKLRHKVMPRYPLSARYHAASGDIRLLYRLHPDGRITDIQHDPSSNSHPALVEAAIKALEEWVYEPFKYERPLVMAQTFRFLGNNALKDDETCFSRIKDSCGWNKRAMDRIQVNDDSYRAWEAAQREQQSHST
ncbi:MAG: hypothetical protein Tsb002_22730 [Wenzhouxiangellaceae bacterium]